MKRRSKLITVIITLAFLVGCAGMTVLQKHAVAMGTHNRIIGDYLVLYDQQLPETQVRWKANVDPIVRQLDDAMTVWDNSFTNQDDSESKRQFYLAVKSQLFSLFFKYGVKIEE